MLLYMSPIVETHTKNVIDWISWKLKDINNLGSIIAPIYDCIKAYANIKRKKFIYLSCFLYCSCYSIILSFEKSLSDWYMKNVYDS